MYFSSDVERQSNKFLKLEFKQAKPTEDAAFELKLFLCHNI